MTARQRRFGYMRISTNDEQTTRLQQDALKEARCSRLFEDAGSGATIQRVALREMLDELREGDVVVVWKIDRLSRSLGDLLRLLEEISHKGAGFVSLTESIDTTTPAGRMVAQMIGVFAEFEREITRERTRAGMQAAKARGVCIGRPMALTSTQRSEIVQRIEAGEWSRTQAALLFKVSKSTIARLFR